jgi:hypothetical protein
MGGVGSGGKPQTTQVTPMGRPVKPMFDSDEANALWDQLVHAYGGVAFGESDTAMLVAGRPAFC